jgi:hypothetical protein
LFLACAYPIWLLSWLGTCVWISYWTVRGEPCSVPVSCLPHAFLQLIVWKSAVNCLKSLRVALLSQDRQWEGAFACTLLPSNIAIVFIWYSTTWL